MKKNILITDTLATSIIGPAQPHPAYSARSAAMLAHMRQSGASSRVTPPQVAQTVVQVVAARQPKLRYPVGRLSRTLPWLKTVLPQRWFERFMVQQFG